MKTICIPLAVFALSATVASGLGQSKKESAAPGSVFVPVCGQLRDCVCQKKKSGNRLVAQAKKVFGGKKEKAQPTNAQPKSVQKASPPRKEIPHAAPVKKPHTRDESHWKGKEHSADNQEEDYQPMEQAPKALKQEPKKKAEPKKRPEPKEEQKEEPEPKEEPQPKTVKQKPEPKEEPEPRQIPEPRTEHQPKKKPEPKAEAQESVQETPEQNPNWKAMEHSSGHPPPKQSPKESPKEFQEQSPEQNPNWKAMEHSDEQEEDNDYSLFMRGQNTQKVASKANHNSESHSTNSSSLLEWKKLLSEKRKSGQVDKSDTSNHSFTERYLMIQRGAKILSIRLSKNQKLSTQFLTPDEAKFQDIFVIRQEEEGIYSIFPLFTEEDLAMGLSKNPTKRDTCKLKKFEKGNKTQQFEIIKVDGGKYRIKNVETQKYFQENAEGKIVFESDKPQEPMQQFTFNLNP